VLVIAATMSCLLALDWCLIRSVIWTVIVIVIAGAVAAAAVVVMGVDCWRRMFVLDCIVRFVVAVAGSISDVEAADIELPSHLFEAIVVAAAAAAVVVVDM
jgi:hypothetical protein